MAKASEQFRQSDVTTWGIVALVVGGLAMMGANVSAALPAGILGGLHKTRIEGASLDQLRQQVADLRDETLQLKRENSVLATRFALEEQQGNEVVRRVGALEVSIPTLLEALPDDAAIDRSSLTASIGEGETLSYDADGGSVSIRQQPMAEALPPLPGEQALPAPVDQTTTAAIPNEAAFGIALGPTVSFEQAPESWRDLSMKLGPLLFGLAPLLTDEANTDDKRIVVGPITQLSEATALCARLERISISCMPMPFTGTPLSY
ncbi:hypothetical protein [Devosia sp. SL43]|uniref:hypothetical protein n=1 Tax=Devosia sp. SL43 TaxID=2806348 RepID=UPI001F3D765B|nr:hypothetical protein [Devosia sp. SL43]UJW86001.1 hypothetical protein IM737_01555 [Devosia sp. SL43]